MNALRPTICVTLVALVGFAGGAMAQPLVLSPCDYTPAESRVLRLDIQGHAQWFSAPTPETPNSLSGSVQATYHQLADRASFGYRLEGKGRLGFDNAGFSMTGSTSDQFKRYVRGDLFAVGAINAELSAAVPSVDLTAGGGIGRFRDVTPLAKAIRLQNGLLDIGALRGPLLPEILQEIAQVVGRQGVPLKDALDQVETLIEATGLAAGGNLDAQALLLIQEIVTSTAEARFCGWDAQASVGLEVPDLTTPRIREAIVLGSNYALVPDPVSQLTVEARWLSGIEIFARYSLRASISYRRRIRENLRIQGGYTFTRDREKEGAPQDRHQLGGTLGVQLAPGLSLTLNGELRYQTENEEPLGRLAVQFSYDVF